MIKEFEKRLISSIIFIPLSIFLLLKVQFFLFFYLSIFF